MGDQKEDRVKATLVDGWGQEEGSTQWISHKGTILELRDGQLEVDVPPHLSDLTIDVPVTVITAVLEQNGFVVRPKSKRIYEGMPVATWTKQAWKIGDEFTRARDHGCPLQRWRVVDVGSRVITAIELTRYPNDRSWENGPPYAIPEVVFDEYDQENIEKVAVVNIDVLIERSSLGTEEVKELRDQVPQSVVDAVLKRADELEKKESSTPNRTWSIVALRRALKDVLEENEELSGFAYDIDRPVPELAPGNDARSLEILRMRSAENWVGDTWSQQEKQRYILDSCVRWLRREVSNEYLRLVIQKWRGSNETVRTSETPDGPPPTAG